MGVYWLSYAGIISTEPEVIKQLIEEAATEDTTTVYDLTIDGNCILFHSDGYGCYGTDFEDVRVMLFEFLFENYDKALVCFEMVKPCQSQGYCFNASWAKPNGEVDWDDEETFYIYRRVHLKDPDEDEGEFDIADIWFLPFEHLQSNKDMPNLMKLVNLAKETGFTNWAIDPTGYNSEPGILMETIWEISDHLEAELEEYDENLVSGADSEAEEDRLEFLADIEIDDAEFELPFELPENFCELITTFKKKVKGHLQEPNYKNNLAEDKIVKKDSELLVNQTEIKEPVPHAPEGFAHVSPQLAELCKAVYGEPVRLVHWQMKDDNGQQQFSTFFRECRRGWYFQMLLTQQQGKWSSEHRVLPSFLNLLEPDETVWAELTKSATAKDWYALDEIFLDTLIYPKSRVILAGSDLVGEEVADEAMKNFGFYVPDEDLLPVLLFEAPNLGVRLISYFQHPDEFAKENIVSDRNTDGCEVFDSLAKAQSRLDQKLSYYISEA